MSDLPDLGSAQSAEKAEGALAVVCEAVFTSLGKVPAVIQKNVSKVLERLMKIPNAYIDGWASRITATSEAQVALIKATGDTLVTSIEPNKSFSAIAFETNASRILRQQVNAAKVLQNGLQEIQDEKKVDSDSSVDEISDDWLNAFEREAVDMSSDHMQKLFGKILAGEILRPKSYSIRTVKLMAQLDNRAAELFKKLCSCACTIQSDGAVFDSRVAGLGGDPAQNSLQRFGLGFAELNVLHEYGLIINDFNSYMTYTVPAERVGELANPFFYANKLYALAPKRPVQDAPGPGFKLAGVQLSQAGKELIGIVDIEEDAEYSKALENFLDSQGYKMLKIERFEPKVD